jgi:hypothetical protein
MDRKIFVFAMSISFGIVLLNIILMKNMYALKDKDGRYAIMTLEKVKSREVTV